MNEFDNQVLEKQSFSYLDILGQDKWTAWTPTYLFTTDTGLTVVGRFKVVGKQCFFQVKSSGTSMATTAGTDYIALPIAAKGYGGQGQMSNDTANTGIAGGHIDVTNSRFYMPSQGASANTFIFTGSYEV